MDQPILFSIVVPTYNRAHIISQTIESVLNQTYLNFELIIVDDGSTDDTEQAVEKYLSEKVFYYKKINEERAAARNYGAKKAKGDYINWFDSDDLMTPDHLQEAAIMIAKYGRVEVIVQGFKVLQTIGTDIRTLELSDYPADVNSQMYKGNLIANSPVIVRRDIALANPFNEDRGLSASEDYELWLRLAPTYKFYTSNRRTVLYISHDEQSTVLMSDPGQLVRRYAKFLHYTTGNKKLIDFLGPHRDYFIMKNYLVLALDLVHHHHRTLGSQYVLKAFAASPKLVFERGFYAFLKLFVRSAIS